ncbi:MAG: hypothetical protein AAGM67_10615, partial [Bacteroidota bacterium]
MGKIVAVYDSKLYRLFVALDKKEHRQFKKWLQSPLHVSHDEVRRIFDFLYTRSQLSAFSLQKPKLWRYLYAEQSYDDNRLRSLLHLALESLQKFVGFFAVQSDTFLWEERFAQRLQLKGLEAPAAKCINKLQQSLEQREYEDADFFEQHCR